MTAPTPSKRPAPRPVFHGYAIIDRRDPDPLNPTPIGVGMTRKECREKIQFDPDSDHYRVRRMRATLFEK
jgi:hypothetical protein